MGWFTVQNMMFKRHQVTGQYFKRGQEEEEKANIGNNAVHIDF